MFNFRFLKATFLGSIFLAAIFFIYDFYSSQFRFESIYFEDAYLSQIRSSNEEREKVAGILKQPFFYLDRGRQSYVFASEDGKYVLKFFDARRLTSRFFNFSRESLQEKYQRLFKGYEIAYLHDRENSGLLFFQPSKGESYPLSVDLIDRFGFKKRILLSEVPFVLQKRALPTREVVSPLLDKRRVAEAVDHFNRLLEMYCEGYRRGLCDLDHNFMHNTGFLDGQPLRLDLGRLTYDSRYKEPEVYGKDLATIVSKRLKGWLERHYPEYVDEILNALDLNKKRKGSFDGE